MPSLPINRPASSQDTESISRYLGRHTLRPPIITSPPNPELGVIVALPCHDEPDLLTTLEDLWACTQPPIALEVLVGVNAAANASQDVQARNAATANEARAWFSARNTSLRKGYVLEFPGLPPRKAGVGLARKLVMDEAVARFALVGRPAGIILCLDADCRVPNNYLCAVANHFNCDLGAPAAVLPYVHDLNSLAAKVDPPIREGIIAYELHLRCMTLGMRLAGHPHPFHTIGSSMAVRAGAYARQGGMNQRQAGEDFHFLNKFFTLPGFAQLEGTTVWPGIRPSHRVPFGTGRALTEWLAGDDRRGLTYPEASYRMLAPLMRVPDELHDRTGTQVMDWVRQQGTELRTWLEDVEFMKKVAEIHTNTASPDAFRLRFFQWLNRFRVMKAQHFLRDHGLKDEPSSKVGKDLLRWHGLEAGDNPETLLKSLRVLEQGEAFHPPARQGTAG